MGRIIVGMDTSEGAATALRWAAREAELHGWGLTAVLAWSYLDQPEIDRGGRFDPAYDETRAGEALEQAVAQAVGPDAAQDVGPDAAQDVSREVVNDLPAPALLAAAAGAELLVVGARGLGGFRALLLGSVSEQCLHHAPCPVAVIRSTVPGTDSQTQPGGALHRAVRQRGRVSALRWPRRDECRPGHERGTPERKRSVGTGMRHVAFLLVVSISLAACNSGDDSGDGGDGPVAIPEGWWTELDEQVEETAPSSDIPEIDLEQGCALGGDLVVDGEDVGPFGAGVSLLSSSGRRYVCRFSDPVSADVILARFDDEADYTSFTSGEVPSQTVAVDNVEFLVDSTEAANGAHTDFVVVLLDDEHQGFVTLDLELTDDDQRASFTPEDAAEVLADFLRSA